MTDELGGEAAVVETDAQAATEAAVSSQESKTQERDYEAEAAEMGWRPKEEWTGKPENWKSAKVYVEHGEVNARVAKIEKDASERFERLEKMHEKTVKQLQAQHAKDIEALKAQKRDAVKAADAEAVERIDEQLDKLKEAGPESTAKSNEDIQRDWEAKNAWYTSDEDMRAYAFGYSNDLAARNPKMTLEENLRLTEERVKAKYPDKFGGEKKPAANGHAAVDGGGTLSGAFKAKETLFSKLPPEAKAQCAKDVAAGLYKDNEAWAKVYLS